MKISYSEYIKKADVSVLVAESIFSDLLKSSVILKIEDVAKTTSGGTPNRSNPDFYNGEIPWLKSGELNDGIINSSEEFITEEGLRNSSAKLHLEGTLLIAMYGATAGKAGILNFNASTNQAVCAVYPNDKVDRDYLFWFFRSHRFQYIEKSKGGAQPNISQSVINDTLIPVPNKGLQTKIAKLLFQIEREGTVDLEIVPEQFRDSVYKVLSFKNAGQNIANELTHQLALVKNLRQQLLQDAVQGKLVAQNPDDEPATVLLQKIKAEKEKLIAERKLKKEKALPPIKPEEIPFEIPEGWVWCRLGEICTKITDGTHYSPTNLQDGEYKYVTAKNIKDGGIDLTDITYVTKDVHNEIYARCNPEKEDILYIKDGATTGIVTINNLDEEFSMLSSVALLKLSSLLNNKFIVYTMRSPFYYNATRADMYGVAITRVTLEKIKNSFILLPPLPEQTRIVQKLEALMRYCDGLEAGIRESMAQNERLLQQVLREALRG